MRARKIYVYIVYNHNCLHNIIHELLLGWGVLLRLRMSVTSEVVPKGDGRSATWSPGRWRGNYRERITKAVIPRVKACPCPLNIKSDHTQNRGHPTTPKNICISLLPPPGPHASNLYLYRSSAYTYNLQFSKKEKKIWNWKGPTGLSPPPFKILQKRRKNLLDIIIFFVISNSFFLHLSLPVASRTVTYFRESSSTNCCLYSLSPPLPLILTR